MTVETPPVELSPLDKEIEKLFEQMQIHDSHSEEYKEIVARLAELYKLKEAIGPKRINPEVLINAATHILGILMVLHFERFNVITSKAFGFIGKIR